MGRLTLRLPETLHRQIEVLAADEGVSLNQYIVYALTRQVTQTQTVQALSSKAVAEQRAAYTAILQSLGSASAGEIRAALAERASVEPEAGLTPEVVQAIQERVKARRGG